MDFEWKEKDISVEDLRYLTNISAMRRCGRTLLDIALALPWTDAACEVLANHGTRRSQSNQL